MQKKQNVYRNKNRIIKTGIDVQISKDTIKLVPNSSFDRVALRGLVDE